MKIKRIGEEGLKENSQQAPFDKESNCSCCHDKNYLVMTVREDEGPFVYETHPQKDPDDKYDLGPRIGEPSTVPLRSVRGWPHGAVAVGIYFCPNCHTMDAIWNQA